MSEESVTYPPGIPLEFRDEEGLLIMDDFDDCISGVVEQFGRPPIVCYDKDKVIAKLIEQGMADYDEAYEWWSFNQVGAWMGEYTPCFLTESTPEADAPAEEEFDFFKFAEEFLIPVLKYTANKRAYILEQEFKYPTGMDREDYDGWAQRRAQLAIEKWTALNPPKEVTDE